MAETRRSIVVLGGGLAGLAAGMRADAPVYEAADRFGGAAASDTVAGFTFDRGIHVLQTQKQEMLDLMKEVGVEFHLRERSAHIYAFGKYTAYPFQINSTNLPVLRRIKCVWDFINRDKNPEPTNYEGWIYKSIGRGFATTFLIPYSEKFWGVHPREMSFEWTGNRVPKANVMQVLRGAIVSRNTKVGTNADFRYPTGAGGYGAVATKLRARVAELNLSHRATRVDTASHRVVFNDRIEVPYEVLLNTIPVPELLRIATDVPAEVSAAAAKLRTNSIMVVNVGVGRANISSKHWVHFPERDISFFRISFPHNFSPELAPPGTSSVSAEVAYPTGHPPDAKALTERVIGDLRRVGVLRADDPVVATSTRDIKYGYCIYDNDRLAALPIIKRWLRSVDIVPGGRYGLWTYYWSDEAILSGLKSAEQAQRHLDRLRNAGGKAAAMADEEYEEIAI